jgi:hypothetical protein
MTWAYLRCSDVAHDKVLGLHSVWSGVRARLKAIERRCFRTGRTKREEVTRLG